MTEKKLTPVLVTTTYRGVFFGYAEDYRSETIELKNARNCLYWSKNMKGFLGLAANGPSEECRVGPAADILLHGVASVSLVTPEAVERWEAAPWSE
jgi:hypothetical protein